MTPPAQPPAENAIDEAMRELFTLPGVNSFTKFATIGKPAFDRLVDIMDGRIPVPVPVATVQNYSDAVSGAIEAFAKRDLETVLRAFEGEGWHESSDVIWGVGSIVDPRVVSFLLRAYASKNARIRRGAARHLGSQRDPRATTALIGALRDRSSWVRETAAEGLGEMGDLSAIDALEAAAAKWEQRDPYGAGLARDAIEKLRHPKQP